jgi:nicotinamidase-related amidase
MPGSNNVYSTWTESRLDAVLKGSRIDTLVITGGETDVCVLATIMGAMDRDFRVILVAGAICSSSDPTHDALRSFIARASASRSRSPTWTKFWMAGAGRPACKENCDYENIPSG